MSPNGLRRGVRAAAALVVVGAVSLAGCGRTPYRSLSVGECLPSSAEVVGRREPDPPRVPCDAEHRFEVYAVAELGLSGDWPGADRVDGAAKDLCYERFERGTGRDPRTLPDGVLVLTIGPTEQSWKKGDRSVECLVRLRRDQRGRFANPGSAGGTVT